MPAKAVMPFFNTGLKPRGPPPEPGSAGHALHTVFCAKARLPTAADAGVLAHHHVTTSIFVEDDAVDLVVHGLPLNTP